MVAGRQVERYCHEAGGLIPHHVKFMGRKFKALIKVEISDSSLARMKIKKSVIAEVEPSSQI